ncbi:MAG TPA: YeeE/YedE thiosulfate transporter family protein [Chloroflexaceae bacterium]|mgnify:CR=1 FL=1|nr:YeeE/YedE thiosulfate transporter family protein [Chloroflexaceae bacterium]
MTAAITSLIVGLVLGYLGQRSRLCFVGGLRDALLLRSWRLLIPLLAFALTAWVAFPLVAWAGGAAGAFATPDVVTLALTVLGGLGVGAVSILANGCPFRQHVLAAQGAISSLAYLAGFLAGAVLFHMLVVPLLVRLLP